MKLSISLYTDIYQNVAEANETTKLVIKYIYLGTLVIFTNKSMSVQSKQKDHHNKNISAPCFVSVNPSMGILFPRLRIDIHTFVFLLLEFHVVCELYLRYFMLLG